MLASLRTSIHTIPIHLMAPHIVTETQWMGTSHTISKNDADAWQKTKEIFPNRGIEPRPCRN